MLSKEILLATNNRHKVSEIKKILRLKGLKVLCLKDVRGKLSVKEDGATFAQNAAKKARAAAKKFGITAVSDDSGLCVNALKGLPGVRSARFVKPPVTPKRLCEKLLKKMIAVPESRRKAFFACYVAVADPSGRCTTVSGVCAGSIAREMKGERGFGYDAVFIPSGFSRTFAQMTSMQKNRLSHRGKAFAKLKQVLSGEGKTLRASDII